MIKYNTQDILKRAAQLADLENSDFISFNEKLCLLNEAYAKLYQMAIDRGDKLFVSELELIDGEPYGDYGTAYPLPSDFYQLQSVLVKPSNTEVPRKSETESDTTLSYDIINQKLVIFGGTPLRIEVKYYPVAPTLTVKAEDREFSSIPTQYNTEGRTGILDCNGNLFLSYTANDDSSMTFYLYNLETDTETSIDLETQTGVSASLLMHGMLGKKSILLSFTYYFVLLNLDGTGTPLVLAKNATEGRYYDAKAGGDAFLLLRSLSDQTDWDFYRCNGNAIRKVETGRTFDLSLSISADAWLSFAPADYSVLYFPHSGTFYSIEEGGTAEAVCTYSDVHTDYLDGSFYCVDYDVREDGTVLIPADDFYKFVGFNKKDGDTGYGCTVIADPITKTPVVKSLFVDTFLNFPNNFYFTYIAYLLAISFKAKQGGDVNTLLTLASSEENAFYSSLSRDSNENVRIKNVYAHR